MQPRDTSSLHVIAKKRKGIEDLLNGTFRSSSWCLAKDVNPDRTLWFFVHENSLKCSYLAGRIIRFEDDGKRKAVVFKIKKDLSMRWPGEKANGSALKYGPAPALPMAALPAATAAQDLYAVEYAAKYHREPHRSFEGHP